MLSAEDVLIALGEEQMSEQRESFAHSAPQKCTLYETVELHNEILSRLGLSLMSQD